MDEKKFLDAYFQLYKDSLFGVDMTELFRSMRDIVIECTHQIWLLTVCDLIVGKAEYSVSED